MMNKKSLAQRFADLPEWAQKWICLRDYQCEVRPNESCFYKLTPWSFYTITFFYHVDGKERQEGIVTPPWPAIIAQTKLDYAEAMANHFSKQQGKN